MPELPEVETVARDLRPRLVGATIVGARTNWVRTLRPRIRSRSRMGSPGGRCSSVGRRAKLLVIDLSGDAALTIHLKMTGQLFVVPADLPGGSVRPPRPRAGRRPRAALPRHPEVREDRPVRAGPGQRRAGGGGRRQRGLCRGGSRTARPDVHAARLPRTDPAPQGPAQATADRPVVPGRRREHLRGRGAVAGTPPPAAVREVPPPAGRAASVRRDPRRSWPRPWSGAAPRSTTTRHRTATARCRRSSTSTSAPASRVRAAAARSSGS